MMDLDKLGEIVKEERKRKNMSQEQLSEDICDAMTISRLENGKSISPKKLCLLLKRLGLEQQEDGSVMTTNEIQIENLKDKIQCCNINRDFRRGLELLDKLEELDSLEKLMKRENISTQQFILRSKAAFGSLQDGKVIPYPIEEKADLLLEALYMTQPNFEMRKLEENRYGIEEIKVINQLAVLYEKNGEYRKASDISYRLLRCVEKHISLSQKYTLTLVMLYYNCCKQFCLMQHYQTALELAQQGQKYAIQARYSGYLAGLLYFQGYALYKMERTEESKPLFFRAYYTYCAVEDWEHAEMTKEMIKEYFDLDVLY